MLICCNQKLYLSTTNNGKTSSLLCNKCSLVDKNHVKCRTQWGINKDIQVSLKMRIIKQHHSFCEEKKKSTEHVSFTGVGRGQLVVMVQAVHPLENYLFSLLWCWALSQLPGNRRIVQMNLFQVRNRDADIENRCMTQDGGRGHKLGDWNLHTYTTMCKSDSYWEPAV